MTAEQQNTPSQPASIEDRLKNIQVSEAAWKEARAYAFNNETTIKAVFEEAIALYVRSKDVA
jgi:hypothetical protein